MLGRSTAFSTALQDAGIHFVFKGDGLGEGVRLRR